MYLRSWSLIQYVSNFYCLNLHLRGGKTQGKLNWKPYGIPIVFPISCEDTITRGDLRTAVHTMLSPMLKDKESKKSNLSDTNNSIKSSARDISSMEDSANTVSDKTESSSSLKTTPQKFHLQMVDESNACIDLSVEDDKDIQLSPSTDSILVFVDWSDDKLKSYDTHYLENLPEVSKHGPAMKKTRSEPLSLYTCLEAFLREEPLVTDDMWLVFLLLVN